MGDVNSPVAVRRVDAAEAGDPRFAGQAAALFQRLVADGAALGWVDPPPSEEVGRLLREAVGTARYDKVFYACDLR